MQTRWNELKCKHSKNMWICCKVEFYQPSCWLYSVLNLLVFQQLETLYLGGNHVRVMCVWESVKNCSSVCKETGTRGWTSRVARDCKLPDWSTHAKHAKSWSITPAVHYRTKIPGWPGRLLAAWTRYSTQSQGQAAKTPRLAKYDFSHSFSPYYIYTLIPTIQRELPERILREKP